MRSNRTLHHRRFGNHDPGTGDAETPACSLPAGQEALYQLSYRRMERRAGLEPATARLTVEVTDIFTTDRGGSWRGTSDAVAALAGMGLEGTK